NDEHGSRVVGANQLDDRIDRATRRPLLDDTGGPSLWQALRYKCDSAAQHVSLTLRRVTSRCYSRRGSQAAPPDIRGIPTFRSQRKKLISRRTASDTSLRHGPRGQFEAEPPPERKDRTKDHQLLRARFEHPVPASPDDIMMTNDQRPNLDLPRSGRSPGTSW